MQMVTYISDLLYRYECVIIPGFGAFLTQYRPAHIEKTSCVFHPPSKTISFNKQLQTNDGLLAHYVASVEKCSYETALQQIRSFTAEVANQLPMGEVSFKNIGDFYLNEEKALQFVPSKKQNYNTAAFGLDSLVSPKIIREVYKEETKKLEERAPIIFTPEKREAKPYIKYAAIAVIALTATGFGALKFYEGEVHQHNFAQKQKAATLVENQIQQATFVIENPLPALSLNLSKQTGNYHIVAGAFQMEENADKIMAQLRIKGYSPKKMEANRYGLHQVLYSSFEDRKEAIKSLHQIQRTENADAWLLVHEFQK